MSKYEATVMKAIKELEEKLVEEEEELEETKHEVALYQNPAKKQKGINFKFWEYKNLPIE